MSSSSQKRAAISGASSESGRERRVFGADRGPAALGLHAAMRRLRPRLLGPEPGAMGHLIEAVPERLRADRDRLEQDLVVRVHRAPLRLRRTVAMRRRSPPALANSGEYRRTDGRRDRGRGPPQGVPAFCVATDRRARRARPRGPRGRGVRVPRAERRREDDDDPLPARARRRLGREGPAPRQRTSHEGSRRDPTGRVDRRGARAVPDGSRAGGTCRSSRGSTASPEGRRCGPRPRRAHGPRGRHGPDLLARDEAAARDRRGVAEGPVRC